jgi:acyl-coenzyme A thioesterase PaaI-like protein
MSTVGATLTNVAPGLVEIAVHLAPAISQQYGFVHAGAASAIADAVTGYAALSLMPANRGVLTAEFKIILVAPVVGDRIVARGRAANSGARPRAPGFRGQSRIAPL